MGFYLVPYCQPTQPTRFLLITAIGMYHFLPVHHFGMACLAGSKVNKQHRFFYLKFVTEGSVIQHTLLERIEWIDTVQNMISSLSSSHAAGMHFPDSLSRQSPLSNIALDRSSWLHPVFKQCWGCPRGVMVKAMDSGIVESEFVLESRYYVHFRANTLGKGMNPLILPAMG